MARTCIYESPAIQRRYAALVEEQKERTGTRVKATDRRDLLKEAKRKAESGQPLPEGLTKEPPISKTDDFLSKLAKYIPAEMIVLTTLAFAAITPGSSAVVVGMVGAGVVLNALYLWSTVLATPTTTPRPLWFYGLAGVAYVFWAAAIIVPVGELVGIGDENVSAEQTFTLALAAFLVPTVDIILTHLVKTPGTPDDGGGGPSPPAQQPASSQQAPAHDGAPASVRTASS